MASDDLSAFKLGLFLLLLVSQEAQAQTTSCGDLGHDRQTAGFRRITRRFYLNIQNPAPCNGTVSRWEYCYYSSRNPNALEYRVPFGVYRLEGSTYHLVSNQFNISISNDDIEDDFTCQNFTTSIITKIQEGDFMGACVHDVDRRGSNANDQVQLNIVGSASGYSLMFDGSSSCETSRVLTVPNSITERDLSQSNRAVLHLKANILTASTVLTEQVGTTATALPTTTNDYTPNDVAGASNTTNSDAITFTISTDRRSQSNAGDIVGGVFGALVVIIVITLTMIIIFFILVRIRKNEDYFLHGDSTNPINAFDNVNYTPAKFPEEECVTVETQGVYELTATDEGLGNEYAQMSTRSLNNTYEYPSTSVYQEVMVMSPPTLENPLYETAFLELIEKNKQEDIYGDLEPFHRPFTYEDDIYGQIKSCGIIAILRSAVRSVGHHLGSGQFANVEEGTWKKGVNKEVRVALKTMKQGATEEDKIKFLQEAAIMAQFRHPNVISLHGVVSKGEPIVLVMELVHRGDLRHYLNSIRPDPGELPPADFDKFLLSFSQQVALGMQYLAGKGFVHRDLAARNILVSDDKKCKISDFGMSRDLADETYYVAHRGKIPVKWTAPEAINFMKYSTASDVWSYGCLLYEIWSLGYKPFENLSNMESLKLVNAGYRLPPPSGCPRMIYQLMILCWNPATSPRPSFRDLVLTLVGNQQLVLSIPQDAIETHQLAGVLGAPLEAGENMYQDLQNTYVNQDYYTVTCT